MVRYFWVELLSPVTIWSGFGSYTSTIILSMLSPGMLLPGFPISLENRDLG
jgi:hypothetical protein